MKAQVVIVLIAMMFVESHQQECGCWTNWLDRDDPSGTGDWEILSSFLKENPRQVCKNPLDIEARTKPGGISAAAAGEVIDTLSPSVGLICKNNQQKDKYCLDYEVRFRCPRDFCEPENQCWTNWLDRDNPSGTGDWEILSSFLKENPSQVCKKPLDIEARTKPGGISAAGAGEVIDTLSPSVGLICKNNQQDDKYCLDYEVRFRCPRDFCEPENQCWTNWLDRDNPSGTGDWEILSSFLKENPSQVCKKPLDIEARTKPGGISAAAAGEVIDTLSPSVGLICKNDQQDDKYCLDYEVRFRCPRDFCEPARVLPIKFPFKKKPLPTVKPEMIDQQIP